jgi:hypothetical protein
MVAAQSSHRRHGRCTAKTLQLCGCDVVLTCLQPCGRGDEWCTEAILRETGPQLTSLSLHIWGAGMAGTGIAASWLTNLSGLRELTMKEFAGSIIDTVNLSSMTVSALHLHIKIV